MKTVVANFLVATRRGNGNDLAGWLNQHDPTALPVPACSTQRCAGEQRLQYAVLFDALRCVLDRRHHEAGIRAAWQWINAEDEAEHPFSFAAVCATFGLDASAVGGALRRAVIEGRQIMPMLRESRARRRELMRGAALGA